jgi:hypothetical protein
VREVQEETGILTRFKSIIAFRHTTNTYHIIQKLRTDQNIFKYLLASVGDPDPHVFGPPGSGSISQMYGSPAPDSSLFS